MTLLEAVGDLALIALFFGTPFLLALAAWLYFK